MDIYCNRCGEPWDIDTLHDAASTAKVSFNEVRHQFQRLGCAAIETAFDAIDPQHATPSCERTGSMRATAMGALQDLLGDDLDGIAAEMQDAEALGMFR